MDDKRNVPNVSLRIIVSSAFEKRYVERDPYEFAETPALVCFPTSMRKNERRYPERFL